MCRIMINSASRDLIFNRSEKLQRIQTLTNEIEKNERGIADKERKIVEIDNKIAVAEKIIAGHELVIKDTEALISNNEKIIKTTEELISCYKALLANNLSEENNSLINKNSVTKEDTTISIKAYKETKKNHNDYCLNLKTNELFYKTSQNKPLVTNNQFIDDSKKRLTAYNILMDCFNNFRLKYLSSIRLF